jgi:bifunctional non-homologous end joining protein LigD
MAPGKHVKASFIEPMLLLRTEMLPEGAQWLYELKYDGYRALAIKAGGRVQLRSRNDNDFTTRYAGIAKALAPLPDETVIDGEVVALDESGKPLVQHAAELRFWGRAALFLRLRRADPVRARRDGRAALQAARAAGSAGAADALGAHPLFAAVSGES